MRFAVVFLIFASALLVLAAKQKPAGLVKNTEKLPQQKAQEPEKPKYGAEKVLAPGTTLDPVTVCNDVGTEGQVILKQEDSLGVIAGIFCTEDQERLAYGSALEASKCDGSIAMCNFGKFFCNCFSRK